MIGLLGFMVVITLVMWLVPQSPAGKLFYRQLVERPLEAFAECRSYHVVFAIVMLGLMLSMLGGGEALAIFGPEFLATYALDVAIYLDAVLISYAIAAARGARSAAAHLRWQINQPLRKMRARRKRSADRHGRRKRKPANDDDADPAPAVCALAA